MKKNIFLLILIPFILGFTPPTSKKPNLNCVSGVVIDQESGRVLYGKNSTAVLPMASTTKIITAIVALEKGNLNDMVIVSKKAASIHGSTAGLKPGESISLEELLYGLMLRSGNDCAIAIAEHISGSPEEFVRLMNEKAMELGAFSTSFKTPHGLDAQDHYTTAEDLAMITAYAMRNSTFSEIVSTKSIFKGSSGEFNRSYSNINKFLYRIDNSDGVKTGFTGNAGKCLVASVKNPYGRFICVILNSSDRWRDAEKLINYANNNYKFVRLVENNESIKRFKVYGGSYKYINGKVKNDIYLPVLPEEINNIKVEVFAPSVLFSPIKSEEIIGNIAISIDEKIIAKYPIYSDREVKRKNFIDIVKSSIFN